MGTKMSGVFVRMAARGLVPAPHRPPHVHLWEHLRSGAWRCVGCHARATNIGANTGIHSKGDRFAVVLGT